MSRHRPATTALAVTLLSVTLLSVILLAAACGDDSGDAADSTASAPQETATTTASSTTSTSTSAEPTTTSVAGGAEFVAEPACEAGPAEMRTFVDDTRVTPATAESDELDSRTLDVWIDRPITADAVPLVIFAHGLTGHPRSHEMHRRSLTEDCFVVVAPAFPLTNNDVSDGFANAGDTGGQVGDVSFLIDQVLADPDLGPLVDPARIGVIGHSLGGLTTAGVALSPGGDERVSAAVVMSAGFGSARDEVAVMVLHGDADPLVPFTTGDGAYDILRGRRLLVTLLGGDHTTGIIDDDSDMGVVVRGLTGAFFVREFTEALLSTERLDALPLDLVEVDAGTSDGPLGDWRAYFTG